MKILRTTILVAASVAIILVGLGQLDELGEFSSLGPFMPLVFVTESEVWLAILSSRLVIIVTITFSALFLNYAVTIWSKDNPKD